MAKPNQKSKEMVFVLLEATGVGKGAGGQQKHTQTRAV